MRCDLDGGGVLLGADFEISKSHAILSSPFSPVLMDQDVS